MNTAQQTSMPKGSRGGQSGFTLIEIIAVLVIIGMLAALAIPKYITMQQAAANSILVIALGAAAGQCSAEYGAQVLQGQTPTTALSLAAAAATAKSPLGDFTFTYAVSTSGTGITATLTGPAVAGSPADKAFQNSTLVGTGLERTVIFQ